MKYKLRIVLLSLLLILLTTGCSHEEVYYRAQQYSIKSQQMMEELANTDKKELLQETAQNIGESAEDAAYITTLYLAKKVRAYIPLIVIPSICIGLIMLWISRYSTFTKIKKIAVFFFILGVPLVVIACAYGLSFLANWFH